MSYKRVFWKLVVFFFLNVYQCNERVKTVLSLVKTSTRRQALFENIPTKQNTQQTHFTFPSTRINRKKK